MSIKQAKKYSAVDLLKTIGIKYDIHDKHFIHANAKFVKFFSAPILQVIEQAPIISDLFTKETFNYKK